MTLLPFEYPVRNAGRNPVRTLLTTLGAAAVVFLVILMGSFVESLRKSLSATGHPANIIVLGTGSEDFIEQSEIRAALPSIIDASVKGIRRVAGVPLLSPEIHHAATVRLGPEDKGGAQGRTLIRGVAPAAFPVHHQVDIVSGNAPGPGEVLIGRLAPAKMKIPAKELGVGAELWFEGRPWKVSGTFAAPGTAFESEIWVPLEDLKTQVKRETITCVIARMESPAAFSAMQVFTRTRLDLELAAVPEVEYFSGLAGFYRPIRVMGWVMACLVVVSGLFGGMNIMIASVAGRSRELGALETLGFSRTAITLGLLVEFLLQAAAGALLASALATLLLSGRAMSFTMGAVSLDVGPTVLAAGCATALVLALAGTLFAAIRLVRRPLVDLIRS